MNSAAWNWSAGDAVSVDLDGAEYIVRINGTGLIIGNTTFNVTATKFGVALYNVLGGRVDDFLVTKP